MNPNPKFNSTTIKSNSQGQKQEVGETWISQHQVNNPIWQSLKISKKVKTDQVCDFIIPDCGLSIIFLSLAFHQQYPLYLNDKFDKFAQSEEYRTYPNKIMLLLFDSDDPTDMLMDITILCMEKNTKLLIGFNYQELASYFASFKHIEKNKTQYLRDKEKK